MSAFKLFLLAFCVCCVEFCYFPCHNLFILIYQINDYWISHPQRVLCDFFSFSILLIKYGTRFYVSNIRILSVHAFMLIWYCFIRNLVNHLLVINEGLKKTIQIKPINPPSVKKDAVLNYHRIFKKHGDQHNCHTDKSPSVSCNNSWLLEHPYVLSPSDLLFPPDLTDIDCFYHFLCSLPKVAVNHLNIL